MRWADVNSLGQSGPPQWAYTSSPAADGGHSAGTHSPWTAMMCRRFSSFDEALQTRGRPTMIVARTIKGRALDHGGKALSGKTLRRVGVEKASPTSRSSYATRVRRPAASPRV